MPQLEMTSHCKIVTQIDNLTKRITKNTENCYNWLKLPQTYKWNEEYKDKFLNSINSDEILKILEEIEQLLEAGLIESSGNKIQELFIKIAHISLEPSCQKEINIKNKNIKSKSKKKWYAEECKKNKNKVRRSSNKKNILPLDEKIRNEHKSQLKSYRRLCNYKQNAFWKSEKTKLTKNNINFWEIWKKFR